MLKCTPLKALLAPLPALALAVVAAGCGGGGVAGSTWQDKNPLPTDTMTVQVAEIGRYGGRFVIGQTYTTWRHVQEGWDLIHSSAAALAGRSA